MRKKEPLLPVLILGLLAFTVLWPLWFTVDGALMASDELTAALGPALLDTADGGYAVWTILPSWPTLQPLAELLLAQAEDCPAPEDAAQAYLDPEKGVETVADALQGANDIIAELLSDDADLRKTLRGLLMRQGHLRSLAAKEEDSVYRL